MKHPQINDSSHQNAIKKLLLQNQGKQWRIAKFMMVERANPMRGSRVIGWECSVS